MSFPRKKARLSAISHGGKALTKGLSGHSKSISRARSTSLSSSCQITLLPARSDEVLSIVSGGRKEAHTPRCNQGNHLLHCLLLSPSPFRSPTCTLTHPGRRFLFLTHPCFRLHVLSWTGALLTHIGCSSCWRAPVIRAAAVVAAAVAW